MKKEDIKNQSTGAYEQVFRIQNQKCRIRIEDACYGEWEGKREVLDETVVSSMCQDLIKAANRNVSKYNPLPSEIIIRHQVGEHLESKQSCEKITSNDCDHPFDDKKDRSENERNKNQKENVTEQLLNIYTPRYQFEEVALNQQTREQIETTLSAIRHRKRISEEWGISDRIMSQRAVILNFYGEAGTGKTMSAEAIANHLGKQVCLVNYSELESKYVGETPKNIKRVFQQVKESDAVLIFDEADSFLSKRVQSITQSADYGVNITRSVLLMELEQFDGVVVFTTNLLKNYDTAFRRRILANIEFGLPEEEAREAIWNLHLGQKLPLHHDVTSQALARRYEKVSGADIKDIVFYSAVYAMEHEKNVFDFTMFDQAYELIMKRYTTEQHSNEQDAKSEGMSQIEMIGTKEGVTENGR